MRDSVSLPQVHTSHAQERSVHWVKEALRLRGEHVSLQKDGREHGAATREASQARIGS